MPASPPAIFTPPMLPIPAAPGAVHVVEARTPATPGAVHVVPNSGSGIRFFVPEAYDALMIPAGTWNGKAAWSTTGSMVTPPSGEFFNCFWDTSFGNQRWMIGYTSDGTSGGAATWTTASETTTSNSPELAVWPDVAASGGSVTAVGSSLTTPPSIHAAPAASPGTPAAIHAAPTRTPGTPPAVFP